MGFSDFLFPRRCFNCRKTGSYFCSACLQLIKEPRNPICPTCFRRSLLGSTHAGCLRPYSLDGLVSVFTYEGIIKKAIKNLKYRFITDLAWELTNLTVSWLKKGENRFWPGFGKTWILLPIPLHPQRKRWRGFNQAELLGKMIVQQTNWRYYDDILIRSRFTHPQVEIKDKKKRLANVKGAFKINHESRLTINGSRIILFDDVWTTGSTIKEAAKVLKRQKASRVWALTIAR